MTEIPQTTADYNSFLRLMTAQMKNQDPLAPLDATQFVTQLAQFSQVEQSVQMNGKLDSLTKAIGTLSSQTAVSLIGRNVEVEGNALALKDGTANFAVTIDKTPDQAMYVIRDAEGNIVNHGSFAYAGDHQQMVWDGKNDAGVAVEDGLYMLDIVAADADGNAIPAHSYVNHRIEQIIQKGGATQLLLDSGLTVDLSAEMRIS